MSPDAEEADDLTVADECNLYRRITSNQVKPLNDGRFRPISGAFNNSSGPDGSMSVSLEDTMQSHDLTPADLVAKHPGTCVAAVSAKFARDEEQRLRRSATEEDVAHGEVLGDKPHGRRKRFAKAAEWAVPPPSVP